MFFRFFKIFARGRSAKDPKHIRIEIIISADMTFASPVYSVAPAVSLYSKPPAYRFCFCLCAEYTVIIEI